MQSLLALVGDQLRVGGGARAQRPHRVSNACRPFTFSLQRFRITKPTIVGNQLCVSSGARTQKPHRLRQRRQLVRRPVADVCACAAQPGTQIC